MEKIFKKSGSEYITNMIAAAVESGERTIKINGEWEIETAIRIPSNFTVVLEDCHLRLADGCYSNIFVNEHHETEVGKTVIGTDRNISIIGRGKAILDGGAYNGLSEITQLKEGLPPIWKNNLIIFTNVDGFKISGFSCYNQRWWALNFIYCSNGYIGNIDFCANDTGVDENGNIYHGLKRAKYSEALVKNADGIDLRQGCHDITIENITGFTEDDSVALTGLNGDYEKPFMVGELLPDIYNVHIRNIATAAFCTNVRLLSQSGIKMHDILIDGVYDMARESVHLDRGLFAVRVGDNYLYGDRYPTKDEVYNITIKNVCGGGEAAVCLAGGGMQPIMHGIECLEGTKMILDQREDI